VNGSRCPVIGRGSYLAYFEAEVLGKSQALSVSVGEGGRKRTCVSIGAVMKIVNAACTTRMGRRNIIETVYVTQ